MLLCYLSLAHKPCQKNYLGEEKRQTGYNLLFGNIFIEVEMDILYRAIGFLIFGKAKYRQWLTCSPLFCPPTQEIVLSQIVSTMTHH